MSHDRVKYIGFYGGEPLLNFPFIEHIVGFVKKLEMKHNRFSFSMTTNGLLLEKYMDFLVKNDFNLLISLDGNEKNNEYRVNPSGQPSFKSLMGNLQKLKKKYPGYFERKVNFNAVLHNKNSVSEIFDFFKTQFEKYPSIAPLNTTGIDENHKEEFRRMYANFAESLFDSEDYSSIEKEMFIKLPNIQDITTFLHNRTDLSFKNYNEAIYSAAEDSPRRITGTCVPFAKKIFVTVTGKILVCERIGHEYAVGNVTPEAVNIDFDSTAETYNRYYAKMEKQCRACYNADSCAQCFFQLPVNEKDPVCRGFTDRETFSKMISSYLDFLEKKPHLYHKIFKEIWVN
jgi:uncharacterized protein